MLKFSAMDNESGKLRGAILFLLLLAGGATGLRDVKISVPVTVKSGDSAMLTCDYTVESSSLYSIRWYFDEEEFYRYVPKEDPPQMVYTSRGIKVDVSRSNTQNVMLLNVSRDQTGTYKCEISEDTPNFQTEVKTASMTVLDVPEMGPTISAERQRLPAGETLRANCTSGASRTAPTITWTLNGDPLNNATMSYRLQSLVLHRGELEMTQTSLQLKITNGLFQEGRLRLCCIAKIADIYSEKAELEVTEDTPLIASITGDASPHSHQSSGCGRGSLLETPALVLTLAAGVVARR